MKHFLGFYLVTGLNPDFDDVALTNGIERLFTLDTNISLQEPEPTYQETGVTWPFFETYDLITTFREKHSVFSYSLFAVTIVYSSSGNIEEEGWSKANHVSSHRGLFIGFDVCDGYLFSSLLNMGSIDLFLSKINVLNNWGLFIHQGDAETQAKESHRLSAEHSPFYVFKVELLKN